MTEAQSHGGGPFLTAALLCERVIEEKDGVLTAIRIVDRIVTSAIGMGTPDVMPPTTVQLWMLLAFKSGDARGRHDVQIRLEEPSGLKNTVAQSMSIILEGEDRGANLVLQFNFPATQEGLYWFDIYLDGVRATRVPLRLVYQRQETGGPRIGPSSP